MLISLLCLACAASAQYFDTPMGGFRPFGPKYNRGAYPEDFTIVGPPLEAVHGKYAEQPLLHHPEHDLIVQTFPSR